MDHWVGLEIKVKRSLNIPGVGSTEIEEIVLFINEEKEAKVWLMLFEMWFNERLTPSRSESIDF